MGDSSVKITEIAHARMLFDIGDVEEIAAPNFMWIETTNKTVVFTFWRRGGKVNYQPANLLFYIYIYFFKGGGRIRGIQRVAWAIVIPAGYWWLGLAESQIAQRGGPENRPQGSRWSEGGFEGRVRRKFKSGL